MIRDWPMTGKALAGVGCGDFRDPDRGAPKWWWMPTILGGLAIIGGGMAGAVVNSEALSLLSVAIGVLLIWWGYVLGSRWTVK